MIYLDNAATTYPKPNCVYKTLDEVNRNAFNAGRGSYKVARKSTSIIDSTRKKILEINSIKDGKVIFTSSATVSLNNLIFGADIKDEANVYISPFEHNSVIRPLEKLKKEKNINIIVLPFDKKNWELDKEKMKNMFALNKPSMIVISHISNVTGYILPYEEIFSESVKYDAINILDSAQGYGVLNITSVDNVNYIIFAGHKSLYGSFGIAGYIKLKNDKLNHQIFGGTGSDTMNRQMSESFPEGFEAGSPNIVAISSINSSLDWLKTVDVLQHEQELTKYLINKLRSIDKCILYLPEEETKCFGIVSINIKGYDSNDVGTILSDEFDICVRTGYHCAPLIHDFIGTIEYNGSVRISLNYFNTEKDIDLLIDALNTL